MTRQTRWQQRHLATLSTHVTLAQAARFRAACHAQGCRPYAAIKNFVLHYGREQTEKTDRSPSEEGKRWTKKAPSQES
jgi:hypothetical protein